MKSIVESQHGRGLGIDGLDLCNILIESETQRNNLEIKSIVKSTSRSNADRSNKPIQLTPVRPGALLALRLLVQARVPEASRCS